jgi:hypothetical protein
MILAVLPVSPSDVPVKDAVAPALRVKEPIVKAVAAPAAVLEIEFAPLAKVNAPTVSSPTTPDWLKKLMLPPFAVIATVSGRRSATLVFRLSNARTPPGFSVMVGEPDAGTQRPEL